jgi:hypothetical protein
MRIILVFIIFIILTTSSGFAEDLNKDEIYKNSFRPDIPRSMQEIPFEDSDYKGKFYSPYALIRIPRMSRNDKEVLQPGYYLVKPFSENNVTYLLFKRIDDTIALIPVFDRSELPKKQKKMDITLMEDQHGKYYIVTIRYSLNSYSARLEIIQ